MMKSTDGMPESVQRRSVIDHVAIVVDDIDSGVEWYLAHFDCEVRWHDSSWAYLQFENCGLALVLDGSHPSHFAVRVDELAQYGTPQFHRDGARFIYLHDHDGNVVEMLDRSATNEGQQ